MDYKQAQCYYGVKLVLGQMLFYLRYVFKQLHENGHCRQKVNIFDIGLYYLFAWKICTVTTCTICTFDIKIQRALKRRPLLKNSALLFF